MRGLELDTPSRMAESDNPAAPAGAVYPAHAPGRNRMLAGLLGLVVLVAAMFAYSVSLRAPWFGTVPEPAARNSLNPELLTPTALGNVNRWLAVPGVPLHRLVVTAFPSGADYGDGASQIRELAYTPLTWLPLYFLGRITGAPVTIRIIEAFTLAWQFLLALGTGLLAFWLAKRLADVPSAVVSGATAAAFQIFLPGAMYMGLNCYAPDSVALVFVVFILLCECVRASLRDRPATPAYRLATAAIVLLFFFGGLVEWLIFVLAAVLVLARVLRGEYGSGIRSILRGACIALLPAAFSGITFLLYVLVNRGLFELLLKFLLHASLIEGNTDESQYFSTVFQMYIPFTLGSRSLGVFLVLTVICLAAFPAAVALRWRGWKPAPEALSLLSVLFTVSASFQLYSLLLRDHEIEIPYAGLKFALPFTLAFVLLPQLAASRMGGGSAGGSRRASLVLSIVVAAAAAGWIHAATPPYKYMFQRGSYRYEENAKRLTKEILAPDFLFASFALGDADVFAGPSFYGQRQIWPLKYLEVRLPKFAGDMPMSDLGDLVPIFHTVHEWGFAPEAHVPLPETFTVGFIHWRDEPCPPEIAAVAPYAARVVETEHCIMYVLDQDGICRYYHDAFPADGS